MTITCTASASGRSHEGGLRGHLLLDRALIDPRDQWHQATLRVSRGLAGVRLATTDEVLTEVLTAFAGAGFPARRLAASVVRAILSDPGIHVFAQSRDSFETGLARYESRLDKGYSLTDCVSMSVMDRERITDVLTRDAHFRQEGFDLLI